VAKPELGAKRQCQNCGAKFFDLNKDPIVCPKCGAIFQGAAARAERAPAKEEDEEEETPQPAGVELVSLDEVEAAEEKAVDPPSKTSTSRTRPRRTTRSSRRKRKTRTTSPP